MQTVIRYGLCFLLSTITGLSCKNSTTTTGLLDASFVTTFKLYMSVPGDVIYDGKDFDMKLEAKPSATSMPLRSISGGITWTLSGTGSLTLVSCPPMQNGVQICRMRYSGGLIAGQSKIIQMKAVHNESQEFILDGFTVATAAFSITIPSRVTVGASFTATITALDAFGNVNAAYTGTAVLYLALTSGRPSVDEVSNFVNGVASVSLRIYKPAWQMQVVAYDKQFPVFMGTSNIFRTIQNDSNYVGLDLVAVPFSATSIRLSWTTLDIANQYRIYLKDATSTYQLIHTISSPSTTSSMYEHTGLTTGQTYAYKIESLDSGGSVVSTDYAETAPKACTSVGAAINSYTIWTKASGPYCAGGLTIASALTIEPGAVVLITPGSVWVVNAQILALGTPRDRITFTLNSNSHVAASGGINVSNPAPSVIDSSNNYVSGSIFKYVNWEYFGGAYWQKMIYHGAMVWRYSSGAVFENISSAATLSGYLDGITYVRNSGAFQYFHAQQGFATNSIFYRNATTVGVLHAKIDNGDSSAMDLRITGNYFALNSTVTPTGGGTLPVPGGAITADPQSTNPSVAITGTLKIADNQFYSNQAMQAGANQGGAIRLNLRGTPAYEITNNSFVSNSATTGGAISFDAASGGNTSAVTGLTMTNNYFSANSATIGGAVNFGNSTGTANNLTITGNFFTTNTASSHGGSVVFQNNASTNVNLGGNFFTSNTATAGNGGALYFTSISATGFSASNNHFSGNTAPAATGSRNIHNSTAASLSFLNAYLEGSTYATCDASRATNLGIADQCSAVGSNTTILTGITVAAYTLPALCINDPTVAGCVGAR